MTGARRASFSCYLHFSGGVYLLASLALVALAAASLIADSLQA